METLGFCDAKRLSLSAKPFESYLDRCLPELRFFFFLLFVIA